MMKLATMVWRSMSLLLCGAIAGSMGAQTQEAAQLLAADAAAGDRFGNAVAVNGDTAIVGAPYDDSGAQADAGAAYVFVRSGSTWVQQAKLVASDAGAGDWFGRTVALSGDTAVVGASGDSHAAGAAAGSAYVFVRSGTTWTEQAKLVASDAAASDFFGNVSMSGDTIVVGAGSADLPAGANAGAAYVFVRSGTTWTQQAKLTASDAADGDLFGYSTAVVGDTGVVAAQWADPAGTHGADRTAVRAGAAAAEEAADVSRGARAGGECTGSRGAGGGGGGWR